MLAFFEEQFVRNASEVEHCIEIIVKEDKANDHLLSLLISKILNNHHIWNCRMLDQEPEVDETSRMPFDYWKKLNQDNHQATLELLKFKDWNGKELTSFENEHFLPQQILQHILKLTVYNRGRIEQRLSELSIPISSTDFVKTITW
ncbi:MAG: hypothetical protein KJ941_09160 [Bacteroidetes bacterium]|nr:hypothetical protein [Bacteroidota bacterium]